MDGHVVIDCGGNIADDWRGLTREQERMCEFVAVSMRYLEVYGTGTDEERALAEYWHRYEGQLLAAERQSDKHSKDGKKKKGKKGPLHITIERIVNAINSTALNDVLDAIEDVDDYEDSPIEKALFSHDDPAPIIIKEIDRVKRKLFFTVRKTGKQEECAFGTINNHLTEIRKNRT